MHQFATGRPDESDKKELVMFAKQIADKIKDLQRPEKLKLPGNYPYREYKGVPLKPKAGSKCTNCGRCAKLCPTGAIPETNPRMTDPHLCISCMRCVNVCPNKARTVSKIKLKAASIKMKKNCSGRKENELFI